MGEGGASFLLVIASGFILLRPRDVPIMARSAGKVVGMAVKGLRTVRDAVDVALRETASAKSTNPEMAAIRNKLNHSISAFDDITTTLKRDMAGVSLRPSHLIRREWNRLDDNKHQNITSNTSHSSAVYEDNKGDHNAQETNSNFMNTSYSQVGEDTNVIPRRSISSSSRHGDMHGVDFIARSFEQAAFLDQKKRILGQTPSQGETPTNK